MARSHIIRRNIIDYSLPIFYLFLTTSYILVTDGLYLFIRVVVAILVLVCLYYMWKKPIVIINDKIIKVFYNIFKQPKELKRSKIKKILIFTSNGYPRKFSFQMEDTEFSCNLDRLTLGNANKKFQKYLLENFKEVEIEECEFQEKSKSRIFPDFLYREHNDKAIIVIASLALLIFLLLLGFIKILT